MRILHIVGARHVPLDPDVEAASGAVRSTLELARLQAAAGDEPWVASVAPAAANADWRGVRLVRLPFRPWAVVTLPGGRRLNFAAHLPLWSLTQRHRYDVVHGQMYLYLRFLRARARIVHVRSDPAEVAGAYRAITAHSHVQVAASHFIAGELRARLDGRGDVHTVSNGIDLAFYDRVAASGVRATTREARGLAAGDVAFLYAGAVVPDKGVLELARAFEAVAAARPRTHLLLAGASDLWGVAGATDPHRAYQEAVWRVLAPLQRAGRVHLLGKLDADGMAAAYAAADVTVVPSTWREGFGRVAVESLASGRPVIASRSGGLIEIVHEGNGLTVPPGDVAALTEAMHTLTGDEVAYLSRQRGARASVAHFEVARVHREMDRVYAYALDKAAGRAPALRAA